MKPNSPGTRISKSMMQRLISVFLTVLLCSSVTLAQRDRVERVGGSRSETKPTTLEFSAGRYTNLSFTGSAYIIGKLTIVSTDRPVTTVTYRKTMKAESPEQAEEFADYIEVNGEELENELSISVETKSVPPWSGTNWSGGANIDIEVPRNENLKIDVRTTAYTIDITGPFAAVDITSSLGDVFIEKITNKTRVSLENGSVSVSDCTGPVTVSTALRPITLTRVDGKLGSIKLRNTNAKIVLESVRGEIDARCDNATISGSNVSFEAGHSQLISENSNVEIDADAVNGDLTIRGENGKINLSLPANTSASYLLQVEEAGRIYTKELPMAVSVASRTR
ncbi:MAG: hypothetical protein E4G91_06765, partial [Candidatus Zixiibacteriota bacterium]